MPTPLARILRLDVAILGVACLGGVAFAGQAVSTQHSSVAGIAVAIAMFAGLEFHKELRRAQRHI